ncbi:serine/threonine-protein kinase [Pseudodesulfovibrio indicus]|uniref:Serine/threonine-protein kinase n=2 Tax=Pseudodesulfovibrio indicus TaxID=1716143 RepID=A0AA94THX9_9BACT|nr:serine/threonine-protein kinase [Pseudodesulfovibrio indicus]
MDSGAPLGYRVPMHIGRYEIRGLLGRGGMGAVYKAAMPVTGRIVALKALRPTEILEDLVGADRLAEMFFQEAATMAAINHPNVAAVLDVDRGGGTVPPHFTMEYFCGNLGSLMGETYEVERESRRLGVEASLAMARGMLRGLDRLHYEGVIHRDVKPFNVMLAADQGGLGTVKLIDFGLSKLRGERTTAHKGMVVGSPYYAAPEQEADPESADERSDLYSVGVTLHRMLTGQLPDLKDAQPLGVLHADLDRSWDDFFATALARDPSDRFRDGRAMLDALDELEARWRERMDAVCAPPDLLAEPAPTAPGKRLRSAPLKVGLKEARAVFGLDDLWRPKAYASGTFLDNGDGTVTDRATGLIWEKFGSRYPLTWERAEAHARRLDKNRYAGRTGWRLPTVDELATLFTGRTEPGEFCLQPAFDPLKSRLWSADAKAFTAAWYADAELGFVSWQDRTCRFFARAVTG